jgi:hypothetical protein
VANGGAKEWAEALKELRGLIELLKDNLWIVPAAILAYRAPYIIKEGLSFVNERTRIRADIQANADKLDLELKERRAKLKRGGRR